MFRKILALTIVIGFSLLLTGCPDGFAPKVEITFPSNKSITDDDVIVVKGTAKAYEHKKILAYKKRHGRGADTITSIRVNGIEATSEDGFATWEATVPLQLGMNKLVVVAEDSSGDVDPHADVVRVRLEKGLLPNPLSAHTISGSGILYVGDNITNAVVRVDLLSGKRETVSGQGVGSGPDIGNMLDFVIDPTGTTGYATDVANNVIVAVDLVSGERRIISGNGIGTGPVVTGRARGITFDEAANQLVSAGQMDIGGEITFALFSVDIETGNRTVISDDIAFSEPDVSLSQPFRIDIDNDNNRAIVYMWRLSFTATRRRTAAIVAVDLSDGSRTLISDVNTGEGPILDGGLGIQLDPFDNNILYSGEPVSQQILSTNLTTGDRTILAEGDKLGNAFTVATDAIKNVAYGTGNLGVYSVALNDGSVDIVSEFSVGKGPVTSQSKRLAVNKNKRHALITDEENQLLLMVNLRNGNRKMISNVDRGEGVNFVFPGDVQWDEHNNRAFIKDSFLVENDEGGFSEMPVILTVDIASGDRVLLIDSSHEQCGTPLAQAWDADNQRLLIINEDEVVSIAPDSGVCSSIIKLANTAAFSISDMSFDGDNQRLVISGRFDSSIGIYSVDLATGGFRFISGGGTGTGETFDVPRGSVSGLNIDKPNNRILVSLQNSRLEIPRIRRIIAVDMTTGNRTILSDNANRGGPIYGEMKDVATDGKGNVLLIDSALDAVFLVDDESGKRVMMSR